MSSNTFLLHQCLHGYNGGHTLITSSVEFDPEVKSVLQIMSDMSGQSMQPGFEEYITGYPLKALGKFAFAKTWHAPEMKRPGCVWTHTLLIDFSDLANLSSFRCLANLFIRPGIELDKKIYSSAVEVSDSTDQLQTPWFNSNLNLTSEIISCLYLRPTIPVLIKVNDSANMAETMLAVWFQQWPRLRRNFSFCTGSISVRILDGRPLDFQAIPIKTENSLSRSLEFSILDSNAIYGAPESSDWLSIVTQDLLAPSILRIFLKEYGADVSASRASFKSLVDLFRLLVVDTSATVAECIRLLAFYYPQPTEASRLKQSFLSNIESGAIQFSPKISEPDLLYYLATTEHHSAIDFDKLDFDNRFQILFEKDRSLALSLIDRLVNAELNPFGEGVLRSVAHKINSSDLVSINQKYKRSLLLVFARLNPALSYNKAFWELNAEKHKEIIDILINSDRDVKVDWQKIVSILIEIDSDVDLALLKNLDIAPLILNWQNQTNNARLNFNWQNVLRENSQGVLRWLKLMENKPISESVFRTVVSILDPNSNLLIRNGSDMWLKVLSRNGVSDSTKLLLKSFSLALAFNRPDKGSIDLLLKSFESVYITLKDDKLSYMSWKPIEFHTQPLTFWKDWDKCKKLINALFDKFPEIIWTRTEVEKIARDKDLKERIILKYKRSHW